MPEGDTIFRTARTLRAVLAGRVVTSVEATAPALRARAVERLVGQRVSAVESRGKHLLVWFAPSGLALHTHMMMSGSWHTYRPGERWRQPRRRARVVLATAEAVAVCFGAPVCELLSGGEVRRHPRLASLGPDALDDVVDLADARRRLDALASRPIGLALLDQRVLAGVGNQFRCEVLHIHRTDPWACVAEVEETVRDALLAEAVSLLRAGASGVGPRRTTGAAARGSRLHVYGRAGRPCLRCATPISVARQGAAARLTYWCRRCQGPGPGPAGRG